jgi:hypothetical protein
VECPPCPTPTLGTAPETPEPADGVCVVDPNAATQ